MTATHQTDHPNPTSHNNKRQKSQKQADISAMADQVYDGEETKQQDEDTDDVMNSQEYQDIWTVGYILHVTSSVKYQGTRHLAESGLYPPTSRKSG